VQLYTFLIALIARRTASTAINLNNSFYYNQPYLGFVHKNNAYRFRCRNLKKLLFRRLHLFEDTVIFLEIVIIRNTLEKIDQCCSSVENSILFAAISRIYQERNCFQMSKNLSFSYIEKS